MKQYQPEGISSASTIAFVSTKSASCRDALATSIHATVGRSHKRQQPQQRIHNGLRVHKLGQLLQRPRGGVQALAGLPGTGQAVLRAPEPVSKQ